MNFKYSSFFCFMIIMVSFSSCFTWSGNNEDDFPTLTSNYTPVYLSRNLLNNSIEMKPIQPVEKSGKIYVFQDKLYVNDVNKGFHVYNYSNPTAPVLLHFLKVPGATDMAIRDGVLYINQATDLVTVYYEISSNSYVVLHRNINVFPQKISPDGFEFSTPIDQIIVDWTSN